MKEVVKVGYIGLGRRSLGHGMLRNILQMPDVEIIAICDPRPAQVEKALTIFRDIGKKEPTVASDYREILQDESIDAVMIMTGWESHVEIAKASVLAGKYTAVEVGCAYDISECYDLIAAYEKTHAPLMMLENCCYSRREMAALHMVKKGLFGEIVHCEGGYHHYLPKEDLCREVDGRVESEHYRLWEYESRNCEEYPTHELGPIAKVLGINRGNRMMTLSSFASKSRSMGVYMKDHVDPSHPLYNATFKQGDIVDTLITCANGETILLELDTTAPRPYYSRNFTVRGTKGMCAEERKVFYLEGMEHPKAGLRDNEEEFFEKYDHPLYKEYSRMESRGGHGGIDWLVLRAFFESVKRGINTPIDAYDTVTWMAIAPLSEMSISKGGAPVNFPDFTHGKWARREPAVPSKYCLDEIVEDPDTPIFPIGTVE